jgi:hypothetical protein
MFIGFCRRKLNKGTLDQINLELAQKFDGIRIWWDQNVISRRRSGERLVAIVGGDESVDEKAICA